jgi:hypothetical protein
MKKIKRINNTVIQDDRTSQFTCEYKDASLTVEAALVMPIFLFSIFTFLYIIQIFTMQERIQSAITKMGLNLAKTAYFYQDFPDITEAVNFDKSVFGNDIDLGIDDLTDQIMSGCTLKLFAKKYLDNDWINHTCIFGGFDGIDFFQSKISNDEGYIDIVLIYKVRIPIRILALSDMTMIQRVKLRTWTGYQVDPGYTTGENRDGTIVYITETGQVYHKSKECSHLKLSISAVTGIPDSLRNNNGAKYKKCEECSKGKLNPYATYYITSYGTRYHTTRTCSGLKRSIREISISEVGSRRPCSRCCK